MTATPTIRLTPARATIEVYEGEPSHLRLPIATNGDPVDVAADYPGLVARLRVDGSDPIELDITVDPAEPHVALSTIPPLTAGPAVWWELRDAAADQTWLACRVYVQRDPVPQ